MQPVCRNVTILLLSWMLNKLPGGGYHDSNTTAEDTPVICVSHSMADHQEVFCFVFAAKTFIVSIWSRGPSKAAGLGGSGSCLCVSL